MRTNKVFCPLYYKNRPKMALSLFLPISLFSHSICLSYAHTFSCSSWHIANIIHRYKGSILKAAVQRLWHRKQSEGVFEKTECISIPATDTGPFVEMRWRTTYLCMCAGGGQRSYSCYYCIDIGILNSQCWHTFDKHILHMNRWNWLWLFCKECFCSNVLS